MKHHELYRDLLQTQNLACVVQHYLKIHHCYSLDITHPPNSNRSRSILPTHSDPEARLKYVITTQSPVNFLHCCPMDVLQEEEIDKTTSDRKKVGDFIDWKKVIGEEETNGINQTLNHRTKDYRIPSYLKYFLLLIWKPVTFQFSSK